MGVPMRVCAVLLAAAAALAVPAFAGPSLLSRVQNKYEVVRVDTTDMYFKHPVKAGTVLFHENALHAHGVKAAHPTTASFRFNAYGKAFHINLEKNTELFSSRYTELGLDYDEHGNYRGRTVTRENGMPESENCWYSGYTANDANEPEVVMDTCAGGFRGLVMAHGESLGIEPAAQHLPASEMKAHAARLYGKGTDPASVDMHVVYRLSDEVLAQPFSCGVGAAAAARGSHGTGHGVHAHADGDDEHEHAHAHAHTQGEAERNQTVGDLYPAGSAPSWSRRKLLQVLPVKYVELMLVNDHQRIVYSRTTPQWDVVTDAVNIAARVAFLYASAPASGTFQYNGAAALYRPVLVGMTSFLNNDPYSMTQTNNNGVMEVNVQQLLPAFNSWRSNPANLVVSPATPGCPNHDNGHLLSGFNFDGATLGYAGVSTMCSFSTSGGIDQTYDQHNNAALHGAIVAHEMGHNFGMQHDSTGPNTAPACPASGYIMNAAASVSNPPVQFSSCSVQNLNSFMATLYSNGNGHTCLDNTPSVVFNTSGVCGDGFVDANEQCDCGASNCQGAQSTDTCCNAQTCRFRTDLTPAASCRASDACCIASTCQPRSAAANYTCRAAVNECDLAEVCSGDGACPLDIYKGAGASCTSATDGAGMCYKASCVSANQMCRIQGNTVNGGPWRASPDAAACQSDGNPCATLYCTSDTLQGCYAFQTNSNQDVQVPDGVPCGDNMQCKERQCVPSANLNTEFYYAPTAWESCTECNTIQHRGATCTSFLTSLPAADVQPCSTPSGLPALEQLCRNDTLGCVYAADIGDDNVSLFGATVAKNTLMFAVLGASALVLVTLACCYQAVTYGHEKEDASPENSQVDGDPEYEDDIPRRK